MKAIPRHHLFATLGLAAAALSSFAPIARAQTSHFQRLSKIILSPGSASLYSATIDTGNGFAFFMTSGSVKPAKFITVAIGTGGAPPTEVGSVTLPNGNYGLLSSG